MKYFLILCTAFFSFQGYSQNIIHKTDYYLDKDGKQLSIKSEYGVYHNYLGGEKVDVKHGPQKEYYKTGEIKRELNFRDGELNGEARGYHKNGNTAEISFFADGDKTGNTKYFYESGVLKSDLNFFVGMKDGECKNFYENKQLKNVIIYKNDLIWQVIANYDSTGRKLDELTVKNGNGFLNTYYPTGSIQSKSTIQDGLENGEMILYNKNKSIASTLKLVNGLKHGEYKIFHDNGKLAVHAFLKEDIVIGPLKNYNEQGILIEEKNFKKTLTEYDLAMFNNNGLLALIANQDKLGLSRGILDGAHKSYFDNGNLATERYYSYGVQDSVFRQFYENGKIKYEALYDSRYQENKRYEKEWDVNGQLIKSYNSKNMKLSDDRNRKEEIENLNKAIDNYIKSRN